VVLWDIILRSLQSDTRRLEGATEVRRIASVFQRGIGAPGGPESIENWGKEYIYYLDGPSLGNFNLPKSRLKLQVRVILTETVVEYPNKS